MPTAPKESPMIAAKLTRRPAEIAFTLIEIMVSVAIFAIILVAIYSSWHAILKASDVGYKAAVDSQRRRIAVEAIEDAFFGVQMYSANADQQAFIVDPSDPEFALISFVAQLPESFPGNGFFDQRLRRVTFGPQRSSAGYTDLMVWQAPALTPPENLDDALPIRLARNVAQFSVTFWDDRNEEWIYEWESTNALPTLAQFSLQIDGIPQKEGEPAPPGPVTTRVIPIPSMTIPAQTQRIRNPTRQPGPNGAQDGRGGRVQGQNPGGNRGVRGGRGQGGRGQRPIQQSPIQQNRRPR